MCHRIVPLTLPELDAARASADGGGRASVPAEGTGEAAEAYPGTAIPVLVPRRPIGPGERVGMEDFEVVPMVWGFEMAPQRDAAASRPATSRPKLIYNTRIETALDQLRRGGGMWVEALLNGRCLVPVRSFFETHRSETATDPQTGKSTRMQYRFGLAGRSTSLLAAISEAGRVSIVTVEAYGEAAGVHHRLPLVLAPGESGVWLGPDFESLAAPGHPRAALAQEREESASPAGNPAAECAAPAD